MGKKRNKVVVEETKEEITHKTVVNYGSFLVDIYYGDKVFRCLPNQRIQIPKDAVIPMGVTLRELKK